MNGPAGPLVAVCTGHRCAALRRLEGEDDALGASLREAVRASRGGVLVVKEVGLVPRWKFRWNQVQETLSVRVLRITEGSSLTFTSPEEFAAMLRDAGLDVVTSARVDRGRPHPHHLIVGRMRST